MDNLTRDQDQLMRKIASQVAKREFDILRKLGYDVEVAISCALSVMADVKEIARGS